MKVTHTEIWNSDFHRDSRQLSIETVEWFPLRERDLPCAAAAVAWSASVCSFSALQNTEPFSGSRSPQVFCSGIWVASSWGGGEAVCCSCLGEAGGSRWGEAGGSCPCWLTGDGCRCCCLRRSFSICLASWSWRQGKTHTHKFSLNA